MKAEVFAVVAASVLICVGANSCDNRRVITTVFCCDYTGGVLDIDTEEVEIYEEVFKDAYNDYFQRVGLDVKMDTMNYIEPESLNRRRGQEEKNGRKLGGKAVGESTGTTCHLCPWHDFPITGTPIPVGDRRRRLQENFPEETRLMEEISFHDTLKEYLRTNLTSFSAVESASCDICQSSARAEDSVGVAIENKLGRRLYAQQLEIGEFGVGAKQSNDGSYYHPDQKWVLIEEDCPHDAPIDASTCYLIKNTHSKRRLYARKDEKNENGIGATAETVVNDDELWYLKEVDCRGRIQCQMIINAHSKRALYAKRNFDFENGFGATPPGNEEQYASWRRHMWMIGIWREKR